MVTIKLLLYVLFFGPCESIENINAAAKDSSSADVTELIFAYISLVLYGCFVTSICYLFWADVRWWMSIVSVVLWVLSSLSAFMIFVGPYIVALICGDDEELSWAH